MFRRKKKRERVILFTLKDYFYTTNKDFITLLSIHLHYFTDKDKEQKQI